MVNPRCFLDVSIGGELEGRMVVELYKDVVPKTVDNFRALCTGERGVGSVTGVPLHYKGSRFGRIIRGFMVQGGAISVENGVSGESIYGLTFEDENFELKHTRKGMLSMANNGPNSNESQFSILTTQAPHLDGKCVVFGKLIKGFGVLRAVEYTAVTEDYCPTADVVIVDCGEIPEGGDDGTVNFFKDGDLYPDSPMDLDVKPDTYSWVISAIESIKIIGNMHFKKQDFKMAIRKYRKAIKYQDLCWEMPDLDQEQSELLRKIKSQILTNSCMCKMKLGDLDGALLDADFAIRETKDNPKAFYRQGQVYMALNNIDAAVESFQKALELEPTDGCIKKELAIAKKKIADRNDLEKKAFSKMFQ
ncbi:peptidyl-prolyl cis-trans isomerase CYP40-like isoform X2 [Salvia miltiorrhiza]|uniref:peptidyl-prolyl cis-trans isomerase CYP40-like isoform X2 n=1 Tax=Salvia miltiorrhiza TaxID=226208 RepID=UPI0025AD5CBC|nr:peptidyl-prolyl cis-trans isomerase CYP40-like isoform X2 [Salvia miltiorrhiza]